MVIRTTEKTEKRISQWPHKFPQCKKVSTACTLLTSQTALAINSENYSWHKPASDGAKWWWWWFTSVYISIYHSTPGTQSSVSEEMSYLVLLLNVDAKWQLERNPPLLVPIFTVDCLDNCRSFCNQTLLQLQKNTSTWHQIVCTKIAQHKLTKQNGFSL